MATTPRIDEWAGSKFGFYVDRHFIDGRWELRPGPVRLAEYHARILRHIFTPGPDGRLPYDVVGWCEPAKSGKSAIAGLASEYAALHLDGDVILASNKQQQAASLMFKSLTDSINLSPHLPHVEPGRLEVQFRNGNTARAIASNSRGEAGARFSLVCFDELWGYVHQDGERLWSEFKTDPTRQNSLRFAVGYGGYTESKLWLELLNSGLSGAPVPELADITNTDGEPACWANGRTFVFWSHTCRQPWQTPAWIESQRASLRPNEFARMIETRFVEGEGDFIDPAAWDACIDPGLHPLPRGDKSKSIFVGLDLALAPGGDDCALVGVYGDNGRVCVAFHKVWKGGRLRLRALRIGETVEPYLLALSKDYSLAGVYFDPWQAQGLAERLSNAGLYCHPVQQTHATRGPLDTALYQMASSGELVLYDHPELRAAARNANAKELGNGLIFLTKAGRGKIDLLAALSNCAGQARASMGAGPSYSPNPFYGESADLMEAGYTWKRAGNAIAWVPPGGQSGHAPGVTWRNCKRRNKGCSACVDELQLEGYYDVAEKDAADRLAANAGEPMSADEADREVFGPMLERQRMAAIHDGSVMSEGDFRAAELMRKIKGVWRQ